MSCFGLVWKTYEQPPAWITGNELLRHILGAVSLLPLYLVCACDAYRRQVLIAFHMWVTSESYEVLGVFG